MIRVIVDSSSDYTPQEAAALGITVVPLSYTLGDETFVDGVTATPDEFYEKLISSTHFPKTSQAAPGAWLEAFQPVVDAGDEAIVFTLSSALSGTCQSARLAATMTASSAVQVIDSLTATVVVRLMVDHALELIAKGKPMKKIVDACMKLRSRCRIVAALDTLEFLKRGGRIPAGAAAIGEAAKLKPLIYLDERGKVSLLGGALGMKRGIASVLKQVEKMGVDKKFPVYSVYTVGTKNTETLEGKLAKAGVQVLRRLQVGPSVGSHIGPDACGVVFVAAK